MMKNIDGIERNIETVLRDAAQNRGDVEGLLKFMKDNGYYEAPASGGYHLAVNGGLAEHSLSVMCRMFEWNNDGRYNAEITNSNIVICGLLHDIGKIGDFGQAGYIKTGREDKPYKTNRNIVYVDHEIRSVEYIRRYIDLTQSEYQAILWHNGLYGKFWKEIKGNETPLYMLLHFADMWSSRVLEV